MTTNTGNKGRNEVEQHIIDELTKIGHRGAGVWQIRHLRGYTDADEKLYVSALRSLQRRDIVLTVGMGGGKNTLYALRSEMELHWAELKAERRVEKIEEARDGMVAAMAALGITLNDVKLQAACEAFVDAD